jgi:hypothetical protein
MAFLVRIGHLGNAHWVDVRHNDRGAYVGRRDVARGRPQMTAWPLRTAMGKLAAFVGSRQSSRVPPAQWPIWAVIRFERLLATHFTALRPTPCAFAGTGKIAPAQQRVLARNGGKASVRRRWDHSQNAQGKARVWRGVETATLSPLGSSGGSDAPTP